MMRDVLNDYSPVVIWDQETGIIQSVALLNSGEMAAFEAGDGLPDDEDAVDRAMRYGDACGRAMRQAERERDAMRTERNCWRAVAATLLLSGLLIGGTYLWFAR